MFFKAVLPKVAATLVFLASAHTAPTFKLRGRDVAFDYNNDKVYGVNLGGWFVLEPWITPSVFEATNNDSIVDEFTYTQALGAEAASSALSSHWNSWIQQDDFNQIAAAGLNHVRIPIGYWAIAPLIGDPYVQGQLPVLDSAIQWARSAGLKVLLDLHGAPGSQNGFDNSGIRGAVNWQKGDTVSQTLTALANLANRYEGDTDVVTAIELLNEPLGPVLDLDELKQFYYDGWGNVRNSNAFTVVTIHDAFEDITSYWNGFMNTQAGVNNVMLDTHIYQIFDQGQVSQTPSQHVASACAAASQLSGTDKWTIVGEWTGAQTDCAKWLNGLGRGARYDGSYPGSSPIGSCRGKDVGTVAGLSDDDKKNIRSFTEAQMDAYEAHTGWIWWTWRTESAPEWDMQALIAGGLFPQPLSDRQSIAAIGDQEPLFLSAAQSLPFCPA
ncbi:exo-1,3-beta-glucanase [Lambiella insularis]|nr:exo-1,3-beta-glucanase [Lambiella insularis]